MSSLDQSTIEVRKLPLRRVAAVRHLGSYQSIGAAFEKVVAWAKAHELLPRPGVQVIGIFYDDPDKQPIERLRSDACLTVPDTARGEGDVQMLTIEGGAYAVATHRGPYTELPLVYRRLYGEWMESSGHRARPSPSFEIYLNDPSDTGPEDLLTEVCVPIL
jgi:AraC family transcriptional regulator